MVELSDLVKEVNIVKISKALLFMLLPLTLSCSSMIGLPNNLQGLIDPPNSLLEVFNEEAISTSFSDTNKTPIAADKLPQKDFKSLLSLPRGPNGGFLLKPGAYELKVKSYCLKAGTHGPSKGKGYLYAPMKGKRAEIIRSILKRSATYPEIDQRQIQQLIWSVETKAKIHQLSPELQKVASILLTEGEIYDVNGGALGLIPDPLLNMLLSKTPPELRRIYEIHSEIRRKLTETRGNFAELERIAVLAGSPPLIGQNVPEKSWSAHPGGFFIRYLPQGYSSTTIQLYVPKEKIVLSSYLNNEEMPKFANLTISKTDFSEVGPLGINLKQVNILTVGPISEYEYDPADDVAVPANTSSQRIGFQSISDTSDCRNKSNLDCSVYTSCFAKNCNCDNSEHEYFRAYGKKYCERFASMTNLSESGRIWRDKTLYCLREVIVPMLDFSGSGSCDCKTIREQIFTSHVKCYTQPDASICDLPPNDMLNIFNIVDWKDTLSLETATQVIGVAKICLKANNPSPEKIKFWEDLARRARDSHKYE